LSESDDVLDSPFGAEAGIGERDLCVGPAVCPDRRQQNRQAVAVGGVVGQFCRDDDLGMGVDLTDLRCVDRAIFDDCVDVLQMDQTQWKEVHTIFPKGGAQFEALADDWRIPDREKLRWLIRHAQYPGAGSAVRLLLAEQKKYLDTKKSDGCPT
jgi:hypothetical protein